jgi:spoIIIJ-associated protein
MKKVRMKGKTVDAAVKAALEVLGGEKENAKVTVLTEGKAGVLGMIGGEEAEVEVALTQGAAEDARGVLQDILDKMAFMAVADIGEAGDVVQLNIKGEDMGRIIGKEGATLKSLETIVSEVQSSGEEKVLPPMNAADRRIIHLFLQENSAVTTFSQGEGRDRRLIIAPRK